MSAPCDNAMASSASAGAKLSAREIVAYSDAELDRYLEEHRLGGGVVEVEDWENLPESFIERLRDRARNMSNAARSKPLDLDQLNARLLAVDENDTLPQAVSRPSSSERSITPPPPPREVLEARYKELETERFKSLVGDGAPPPYPIELVDQIFQNPVEYHEMLRPWHGYPDDLPDCDAVDTYGNPVHRVFEKARERWRDFRQWQRYNRRLEEDGFQKYVEEYRREGEITGYRWVYDGDVVVTKTDSEEEADLKKDWDREQARRQYQRRRLRQGRRRGGFDEYVEEAKRRLARKGFTRSFELDGDPRRQDKLTTWIEYLDFEYAWYELHARDVEHLQQVHDEAWKKLVDTGVLRPHETDGSKVEPAFQRQSEREQAQEAVEAAKSNGRSIYAWAQKARHNRKSSEKVRVQKMIDAKARVEAAEERLKSIRRRNKLILEFVREGTWAYETAKTDLRRQSFLLEWLLEKISALETGVGGAQGSNGEPHAGRGTKRRLEGYENRGSGSKRQKQSDGDSASMIDRKSAGAKRACSEDAVDDGRLPKRSRGRSPSLRSHPGPSVPISARQILGQGHNPSSSTGFVELGNGTSPRDQTGGQTNTILCPSRSKSEPRRRASSKSTNTAEQLGASPRRSARIAKRNERAEQLITSGQPTVIKPGRPQGVLARRTDPISVATSGGRRSKNISPQASTPQGRVRKTTRPQQKT